MRNKAKRRRITAHFIDMIIVSTIVTIMFVILSIVFKWVDYSKGWHHFYEIHEQTLDKGFIQFGVMLVYDMICQFLFGRSFGQYQQHFRVVPTQPGPHLIFGRRILRSLMYALILPFLANFVLMMFVPPYKSLEDYVFKFDLVVDEEE